MYYLVSKDNFHSKKLFERLSKKYDIKLIINKDEFEKNLQFEKPLRIFFLHWSYIIPEHIVNNYECINIHTSNLPEGRGGSPLQNQILDGIILSRVNALRMDKGIDTGPIYCSQNITLHGNLFDIWQSISEIAYNLICKIIDENIQPIKQNITKENRTYKRKRNNLIPINDLDNLDKLYDYIRMLDSPDYPQSYLDCGPFRLYFNRAKFDGKSILSDVKIEKIK